jgi:hypothetical protein
MRPRVGFFVYFTTCHDMSKHENTEAVKKENKLNLDILDYRVIMQTVLLLKRSKSAFVVTFSVVHFEARS